MKTENHTLVEKMVNKIFVVWPGWLSILFYWFIIYTKFDELNIFAILLLVYLSFWSIISVGCLSKSYKDMLSDNR